MTKDLPVNYKLDRSTFWYVGQSTPSFIAVIVTYSALRHCTDGVLDLLNAKLETHIIRGPQEANERGSEVAEMRGPRGAQRGLEGPRGVQRGPRVRWWPQWQLEGQGPFQQSCWGIAGRTHCQSHSEFPPTMVSLGSWEWRYYQAFFSSNSKCQWIWKTLIFLDIIKTNYFQRYSILKSHSWGWSPCINISCS